MLGELGHHDARHLPRHRNGEQPVRAGWCVLMIAAWLLFLAVVLGWILSLKGVKLWL
jgi:hypothetical protein